MPKTASDLLYDLHYKLRDRQLFVDRLAEIDAQLATIQAALVPLVGDHSTEYFRFDETVYAITNNGGVAVDVTVIPTKSWASAEFDPGYMETLEESERAESAELVTSA